MLTKEEYILSVRRPYPPLLGSLIWEGYVNADNFTPFVDREFAVMNGVKTDETWYYAKVDVKEGGEIAYRYWLQPGKLKKIEKEFKKREDALMAAVDGSLEKFAIRYGEYMPSLMLVWAGEQPVEAEMKRLLNAKTSEVEARELMNLLNIPLQDNFYKLEEYDLVMTNDIKAHVKEYEWLNSRYGEENPYMVEEAEDRLAEVDREIFLKEWDESKEKVKKAVGRAKELLGEDESVVDMMQFIMYYRTQRTDIMNKAGYMYIPKFKMIAEEKGLTYRELLHCLYSEVVGDLPARKIINERIKEHALVIEDGVIRCVQGEESRKVADFFREDVGDIREFKGAIACKGKVKGVARIIRGKEDFGKMKEGDILVTSMTTPNMLSVMKKAAAFITDEGGITCHAAIISREMEKPCIIGTTIATKVLKDGDIVEVNANHGVVKVVKKA